MSLLQWVKNGLGLGPKRTSETIPLSPETSNICEERLGTSTLAGPADEYAELHTAALEYREAVFAAANTMYGRVVAAGYDITDVKLTTFYPVDRNKVTSVLRPPRRTEVELTVAGSKASGTVRISFKV